MAIVLNALLSNLLSVSVLVAATMGITLIYKTSFTTNFAQGSIAVIGGYIATFLCASHGISIWWALLIAIVASAVFAALVDIVLFRMGRFVTPVGKQIITMGIVMLIAGGLPLLFGSAGMSSSGMEFISSEHKISFSVWDGEVVILWNSVLCFAITATIIATIFILLKFSKWGISVRATAANERVAQMMGINTKVVTAVTWGIAGGLGALAAVMLLSSEPLSSAMMTGTQVNAFMAAIVGSFDSFVGPIVGAVLLPILRYFFQYYLSLWANVIMHMLILVIVLIKPTGLFGKKTINKV